MKRKRLPSSATSLVQLALNQVSLTRELKDLTSSVMQLHNEVSNIVGSINKSFFESAKDLNKLTGRIVDLEKKISAEVKDTSDNLN